MQMRTSWRRSGASHVSDVAAIAARFDVSHAVAISSPDQLLALSPAFLKSLSTELDVQALAGRLCPVLLTDHSVAILTLAEHVGSDQADELARRIQKHGYSLASPQRYVLPAPLLLAIARNQVTAQTLKNQRNVLLERSKTALADAFHDMVEWGVRHGASDLHLNVRLREPESEVRFTLSGRYVAPERFRCIPTSTLIDMLAVAWMDIRGGNGAVFDPLIEQQGSLIKQVDGKSILLRWASLAADQGPSVCLRLLQREAVSARLTLEQLGYLPDQIHVINRAMGSEGGTIVFAGTVGSGKSTTLASLIAGIPGERKVVTIEDPVEYLIPGAIQNSVARDLGASVHDGFAAKLRTLKRSAMTDVLLGEIRDRETGRAFMDLAGSGVSVYTTVHAPSARLIGERMASDFIGISRHFLSTPGVLKLLVYQVLLRRLCPHCALPASFLWTKSDSADVQARTQAEWMRWLDRLQRLYACDTGLLRFRNPLGCTLCINKQVPDLTGYSGRTVAAEYIEPALSPGFLHSIQQADPLAYYTDFAGRGGHSAAGALHTHSAMQCAMYKALHAQVDPREIEVRFHSFETQERMQNFAGEPCRPVAP